MSDTAIAAPPQAGRLPRTALKSAGIIWFLTAVAGQWAFVFYLAVAYGVTTLTGDFAAWNDTNPITGHVEGDGFGNLMFAGHVLLAMVMTVGGTLQLVPQIRARAISFHRLTGKVFIVTALFLAIGGLWMVWGRGSRLADGPAMGVSLNAIFIIVCASLAWFNAARRKIDIHRRWAMRTFIVANGVWFYRIGFMGWIMLHQAPVGSTPNLDGPFDYFIAYASFLLPLAILELYMRAQDSRSAVFKLIMAAIVLLGALVTAAGSFAAYMILWAPHIS